jgi:hypothetical protein
VTEDLEGPRSIPELRERAGMLPDVIKRELLGTFRSAEFRFLGSPINQMQLLRTRPRKFTLQIVANLFGEPLVTLEGALKRLRVLKEAATPNREMQLTVPVPIPV